ncbi:MAG TPA: hypothetical protein VJY62_15310 [Bacteroidia bacterium]|nr:hypothetical protein [Bacteroidia bacterium]
MTKKINEIEKLKALLVIVTGLVVIGILTKAKAWFYAAGIVGVITLAIPVIGYWTVWLWYEISEMMGWFMSGIILSAIFFLFLYPISWFVKMSNKNMMQLKRVKDKTVYTERNHKYTKEDIENTW